MTGWFSKKSFMIGLDIGFNSIKMASLKEHSGRPVIESVGYYKLDTGLDREEEVSIGLKEIIRHHHLKGRTVSCSISLRDLAVRYFTLPHMSPSELKEAVVWEAPKHLPFPLKESVYDYLIVDDKSQLAGSFLLMIAAVPEKVVSRWVRIVSRSGVPLGAFDVPGMALLAYFDTVHGWEEGSNYAVLNLGYQFTGINIFKDGNLRLTRDIGIAGVDMDQSISDLIGLPVERAVKLKQTYGLLPSDDSGQDEISSKVKTALEQVAEKIVVETQRSIDFYTSQYREKPVEKLYITGGESLVPGLRGYIENHINVPVVLEDPFESMQLDGKLEKDESIIKMGPFFTLAIGLATRRAS